MKQLLRLLADTYQWQPTKSGHSTEGVGQTHPHPLKRKSEIDNKVSSFCKLGLGRKALAPGAPPKSDPRNPHPTTFETVQSGNTTTQSIPSHSTQEEIVILSGQRHPNRF